MTDEAKGGAGAELYIGAESMKMHLSIRGITLATEGDLCRDKAFRKRGVDRWTRDALMAAEAFINARAWD